MSLLLSPGSAGATALSIAVRIPSLNRAN
jgi:hypothetical protein